MEHRGDIAGALDGPFIILFEQDRTDEADRGIFVGEDVDPHGPPLDLAVEPRDRVGRVLLDAMLGREGHAGDHIGLGLVRGGELWQLGAELVGDVAPLRPDRIGIVLGKGGGDESGDDAPTALAGMSQRVAREVDAATLPGDVEHLGDGGIDALVSVGHVQLDATRAAAEVWPPLLVASAAHPWVKSWEDSAAARHGWLEAG